MTIKMLDAVVGGGKTTAIIQRAVELAATEDKPVSISLPTRSVITEKVEDAERAAKGFVPIYRVDSDTAAAANTSVAAQLESTLEGIGTRRGAVVFTTHKTFNGCANWIGRYGWKFFVDELFDPVSSITLRVPRSFNLLTAHTELATPDERHSEVRLRYGSKHALKLMCEGTDDAEAAFAAVTQYLARPERWTLYVNSENYQTVTSGIGRSRSKTERERAATLTFWVVAKPWFDREGLDVTMASACMKDRLLYKLWQRQGTGFDVDRDLASGLHRTNHDGADLQLICMNIDHWSTHAKNGGKACGKDGTTKPQQVFERLIAQEFGDEPFIYNANTAWTNDALFPNGTRLPLVLHGKCEWDQHVNVAFMPSTLPTPDKWQFLNHLGFSADDIRDEYYHTHALQTTGRSRFRLCDGVRTRAILPGIAACEYIKRKVPQAEIIIRDVLESAERKPRASKHASKQERNRADYLARKTAKPPPCTRSGGSGT